MCDEMCGKLRVYYVCIYIHPSKQYQDLEGVH